jgi:xylulose-5-phosphate/fructose-6-phosphate phosphoketolase
VLAPVYLEGTYSEIYPNKSEDEDGHARLLQAVLVPRRHRLPLHAGDPRIDPRGRRTRLLHLHAFGAAFDNPDLLVVVAVGDGEAETGPLATSWHSSKFLNPPATARCCRSCI